jgi:Zn-dependent alcohol dehydrogenase
MIKVDKSLDLASLAPLGCGVGTGAGAVLNTLSARAGSSIAIFGAGIYISYCPLHERAGKWLRLNIT